MVFLLSLPSKLNLIFMIKIQISLKQTKLFNFNQAKNLIRLNFEMDF